MLAMFATLVTWLWLDIPGGPFAMAATSVIATPAIDSAVIRFAINLATRESDRYRPHHFILGH
jgi:hypothetical protein